MNTPTTIATISFPLSGLKPLYRTNRGGKLVVEVDIKSMKKINDPATIDDMMAEARLEYYSGKTKGYTDMDKLVKDLNS